MRRALMLWAAASALVLPVHAFAESPRTDGGFRLHVAAGYPAVTALGVGWKFGRTEFLLQGGGAAVFAAVVGTAELSATYDLLRAGVGHLYVGPAASLLHARAFTIDCYDEEPCTDQVATHWLASARVGGRLRLDRRARSPHSFYLDLSAGPQLSRCVGDCGRESAISAAVTLRLLVDF